MDKWSKQTRFEFFGRERNAFLKNPPFEIDLARRGFRLAGCAMGDLHCRFCKGQNCRFENYDRWHNVKNTHPALKGLYSSWITEEILAMARPSEVR
jgi:protein tyrosine phosphatase domain-containing protein 1